MSRHTPPLIVHLIYALETGGLENGLVNIINRLPPGSYRHAIVCITRAGDFSRRLAAGGVEIYELHKPPGHGPGFYLRLWRLLRRLRPAIVHSRNLAALEAQLCTLACGGVRRIHGEHGREINDIDGRNRKYLLLRRAMRILIHRYVAVSRDLEQWLIQSVGVEPQRVSQIYNGVDAEKFAPGASAAVPPRSWAKNNGMVIVGTVGRLTPVKDQHSLLQAMAGLRSSRPELFARLRLVIAGDGPLMPALRESRDGLGLQDAVWLAGNRDDVADLLRLMDIFVLPSLAEGISNTLLEAQSVGLPVIATRVGGNVELVEEGVNGRLVPVSAPDALGDVLAELASDPVTRRRLGENARRRVREGFTWDRTVQAYRQLYDEVLSSANKQRAMEAG